MHAHPFPKASTATAGPTLAFGLRWIARVWSVASGLLIAAFAFGGGPDSLFHARLSLNEIVTLAFFPFGVVAGLAIATFGRTPQREGLGGFLALASLTAFYAWMFFLRGELPTGPYFALLAAPGALFLATWVLWKPPVAAR